MTYNDIELYVMSGTGNTYRVAQWMKETAENQKISVEELETRLENIIHGTPDEIIAKMKDYKKIGIDHFIMFFPKNEEVEQIKIFAKDIMPKI